MRACRREARADSGSESGGFTDSATEELDIRRTRHTAHSFLPRSPSSQLLCYAALFVVLIGVALALLTIVLNVGIIAVGALNPAWQTFRALESRGPLSSDDDDDAEGDESDSDYVPNALYRRNWASYWVVVACLYSLESLLVRPTIGNFIPSPLYPGLVFSALLFLTSNNAEKSGAMYVEVARPALLRMEGSVERSAKAIGKHLNEFVGLAVVRFHEVVEPYALQLRQAAAMSARQLQAQAREPRRQIGRRRRGGR